MSLTAYDDRRIPSVFSDMGPSQQRVQAARRSIAFWGLLSILLFGAAVAFGAVAWWQYTQATSVQRDIVEMQRDLREARANSQTFAAVPGLLEQIAEVRGQIVDRIDGREISTGKRDAARRVARERQFIDPGGDRPARVRSREIGAVAFTAEGSLKAELAALTATRDAVEEAVRNHIDGGGGPGGCDPRDPRC